MCECVRQWMGSLSFESESLCTVLSLQACESEARYAQLRLAAHRTRAFTSCNLTHTAPSRALIHILKFTFVDSWTCLLFRSSTRSR